MHVGCQSGDDAIYLLHGLSRFVLHFIALNAASPWFDSTDSRFACSRLNRFSIPTTVRCRGWPTGRGFVACSAS